MKKSFLLVFSLISCFGFAQDVLMQNGTVTTCSGTFYDSGGEFSNYAGNENYVITICPEDSGQRIKLDFQEFSTQIDVDILKIYDGDDTTASSLGIFSGNQLFGYTVGASINNLTGCLTLEFQTNDTGHTIGWAAAISCAIPCQDISAQLDSTSTLANSEGIIEVCIGETVNLNGSGTFGEDGTGASYTWDLGDGNEASGEMVAISYNIPGIYLVNLEIRDTNTDNIAQGCTNTNSINQVIRVSGLPNFTGTQAEDNTLCYGETTTIQGVVNPLTLTYNCPPPESELTYLPDGSGAAYETGIMVTCFDPAQTLSSVDQIESICINMEHSWSNDLDIYIISPSGQIAHLFDRGGGGTYFGGANNSDMEIPGEGADYCFSLSGSVLLNQAPTITAGSNPPADSWMSGTYLPVDDLSSLIGSPLNGNWTIQVIDNLAVDNGYIFSWELNFDDNLQLEDYSYIPSIVSQSWESDSSITEVNGNTISVAPDGDGEFCYTYRTVDVFGCEYTEEVCINVTPEGDPPVTYYEDIDGDGFGDPESTIMDCSDTPPFGYAANGLDCNDTNNLVNPDADDSEGNGIDENCDGVDGDVLGIDDFNLNDIKVITNPFNDKIIVNVPSNLTGSQININIYDLNGRVVYEDTHSNIDRQITINNLSSLEKATYFLEISNEKVALNVVRKLMKL